MPEPTPEVIWLCGRAVFAATKNMEQIVIRIGQYDAFDKWEILCRHWENPGSVGDGIVTKWDAPALPRWHSAALAAGRSSCIDYIRARFRWIRSDGPGSDTDPVHRGLVQLSAQLADGGIWEFANGLTSAITSKGFHAPLEAGVSPELAERLREVFRAGAIRMLGWTEGRGEVPDIEILRKSKPLFPVERIQHKHNVLCLFCALNYGRADVIHVYDACPDHVTLVDNRADLIDEMRMIYPRHWEYVASDYKEFLQKSVQERHSYDLVVSDNNITIASDLALDFLPQIASICSGTYIMDYTSDVLELLGVAATDLEGLSRNVTERTGIHVRFVEMFKRNERVFWAVMQF